MNKFNYEGYHDPTAYEALVRIEREEKKNRKINDFRPLVYICSPYRGDITKNITNAKKYSRFAVKKNYVPLAPHLLFTQFMDDNNGEERCTAMQMNFVLMTKCAELWVFGENVSQGMAQEIKWAKTLKIQVRHFTREMEEII